MVAIAPFRALRYNLERVGDLSAVVAPPYDVISPEQQAQLHAASPYNIVRLILGQRAPTDTETNNWYTRAQRDFEAWQQAKVLVRDPAPAVYLYEHGFEWRGRPQRRPSGPSGVADHPPCSALRPAPRGCADAEGGRPQRRPSGPSGVPDAGGVRPQRRPSGPSGVADRQRVRHSAATPIVAAAPDAGGVRLQRDAPGRTDAAAG